MRSSGFILALGLCLGCFTPSSARAVGNADFITRLWQMEDGLPHNNVGLIKKEIADTLSLRYHTIDTHLRNIFQKLHVHTRTGAVAKALKERLF